MKHLEVFILAVFLLLAAGACETFADVQVSSPECSVIVKNALDATNQVCDGTGRNQACYGHVQVRAEPQPGLTEFKFDQVGAKVDVDALKTLHLSPMDTTDGTWGVALMHLQANLPDTAPGENVTLLLFGDVEIRNAIPTSRLLNVTTSSSGNTNVRREPAQDAFVLGTLPASTSVIARGRSEDNAWVYVDLPNNGGRGWLSSSTVIADGNIQSLSAIKPFFADAKPMQAFYLRTGNNASTCAQAPNDGLVIQTPEGEAEVRLWINEVKIRLKSTVFVEARENRPMSITTLEGEVHVEALGVEQTVPVGSSVSVQLNQNQAPVAPPSRAQTVPKEIMPTMPVIPTQQNTPVPPTETPVPPTNTEVPTQVPPTRTATTPPTATDIPPTDTSVPTERPTDVPPTDVPPSTEMPTPLATEQSAGLPTAVPPASTEVPTAPPNDPPAFVPPTDTPQSGDGSQQWDPPTAVPPATPEATPA